MKKSDLPTINLLGALKHLKDKKEFKSATSPALSPGALIHVGSQLSDKMAISVCEYDSGSVTETEIENIGSCAKFRETEPVTWVQVSGLHDVEKVADFGEFFEIHPLILEDILNTVSRSKVEESDEYVFIVSKLLTWDHETSSLAAQHFAMVILPHTVITFIEEPSAVFEPVLKRIRDGQGRIRKAKEDYLAWAILDALVDNYLIVVDQADTRLVEIDDQMQSDISSVNTAVLFGMKREIAVLYRMIRPIRDIATTLYRAESKLLTDYSQPFYRDLYDHAIHVIEHMENLREQASGLRDFHMASVSNRMNEIMKVLTIFSAFFLPITFMAGVYGMNFEHMPELKWRLAYPVLWAAFISVAIVMFVFFRRKKWL